MKYINSFRLSVFDPFNFSKILSWPQSSTPVLEKLRNIWIYEIYVVGLRKMIRNLKSVPQFSHTHFGMQENSNTMVTSWVLYLKVNAVSQQPSRILCTHGTQTPLTGRKLLARPVSSGVLTWLPRVAGENSCRSRGKKHGPGSMWSPRTTLGKCVWTGHQHWRRIKAAGFHPAKICPSSCNLCTQSWLPSLLRFQ